ncbi:hypothetical protein CR492_06860 [Methylocella silvestris]|uniref:Uncharacterized protein n=1 Tax=Methylocella silvestris TaxID=199596 RepID=A0A2J7TIZ7_METSI|nr:hypothetical protein CR492_06860 [Methylocella silvestris]
MPAVLSKRRAFRPLSLRFFAGKRLFVTNWLALAHYGAACASRAAQRGKSRAPAERGQPALLREFRLADSLDA